MASIIQAIEQRRSVRTFDGAPLSQADRDFLLASIAALDNPFGVPVETRLLDAAEHGLKSPVIVGEHAYLAAKVALVDNCELAFGYEFESLCLEAATTGLGTVMLAASLNRSEFERAMEVGEGEVLPCASPVGRASDKRSVRERAMRRALKADARQPFGQLFFEDDFAAPLADDAGGDAELARALACVRLAPSATNKQPWRVVVADGRAHFYEQHTMNLTHPIDIQKVDMGIALAHFDLAMRDLGREVSFEYVNPGIPAPDGCDYIISATLS